MIKLCFICIISMVSCVYNGFCYSSKPICVGLKVGVAHVHRSRKLNKGSSRFSIADSRGMPQFVHARVISRAFNPYTCVESNWFASLVRALATISRVTLLTFRVLARDTHSSVNFELSCTVTKAMCLYNLYLCSPKCFCSWVVYIFASFLGFKIAFYFK